MNAIVSAIRLLFAASVLPSLLAPAVALAGSSYQTTLVPVTADSQPGFSSKGSSIKIVSSGNLKIKGKLKRVVDESGDRVTTDRNDGGDDYCVQIDLYVPAIGIDALMTVEIPFDLNNGNGTFKENLNPGGPVAGAQKGDAIVVQEVRVLDSCTRERVPFGYDGVAMKN
jgi:hypothetical protein